MRSLGCIPVFFLVIFFAAMAAARAEEHSGGAYGGYRAVDPAEPRVTFESLATKVEDPSSGIDSVEKLVCSLPKSMRSRYTRVYASRSLQNASLTDPRVLFFDPSARLVIAQGGHPDLPGGRTLEIMEADETTGRFSFHEIEFPADGGAPIVRRQDPKCLTCHGEPPRPRWDAYFLWPGVFGSEDDQVTFGSYLHDPKVKASREFRAHKAFEEKRRAQKKAKQGRFACLEEPGNGGYGDVRPNADLSENLQRRNFDNVAHLLRDDPDLFPLRYAIAAAIFTGDCRNLPGFFPEDLQPRIEETLGRLAANVNQVNRKSLRARADRYEAAIGVAPLSRAGGYLTPSDFYDRHTAAFRFLVEGFSTHKVIDWNIEATVSSYDFDLSGDISGLEGPVSRILLASEEDKDVGRIESDRHRFEYHRACKALRDRHLKTFPLTAGNRARVERALDRLRTLSVPDETAPFTSCLPCHRQGNNRNAPVIPFEDRAKLVPLLASDEKLRNAIVDRIQDSPPSGGARMPPGGALPPGERQAIERFIGRLR